MAATTYAPPARTLRLGRTMWIMLIVLCLIGAAAAIRRMAALVSPSHNAPAQLAGLDAEFAEKRVLTLIHIVPGLVFMALVPFQLSRTFRSRHMRAHRWMGRSVVILGLSIGLSAIPMSRKPIGGTLEITAIAFFDALFLASLLKAFIYIRHRDVVLHREWMIRAMSVALGVATVRPIMGVFFATSRVTGLTPREFFGIAFWIGFSSTYIAAELWIRNTRSSQQVTALPARVAMQ